MNCFYHQNCTAIGLCKCCNKGLCKECAVDLEHGLACKGRHEERVESINSIIEKNAAMYKAAPRNSMITPIFYLFMGIVFAGFGYVSKSGVSGLPFVIGIGFIVFSLIVFVRTKALFSANKSN